MSEKPLISASRINESMRALYKRAAMRLVGPRGAWCAGWLDGYQGLDPDAQTWSREHQLGAYEDGWLEGADAATTKEGGAS